MFDTATLTISGNVVADPKVTGAASEPDRVTFRMVSNRRRRDADTGEWKQVGEFGINVVCWRKLARGVAQALRKGDPVLVVGQVTQRRFTGNDGEQHWSTEVTAEFVGHDLSQGYAERFSRFTQRDAWSRDGNADDARQSTSAGVASADSGSWSQAESADPAEAVAAATDAAELEPVGAGSAPF